MTTDVIVDDAVARCNRTGETAFETSMLGWINRAYEEIQAREAWYWAQENADDATTTADQEYVDLDSDCVRVIPGTVRRGTCALKLVRIAAMDQNDPSRSSSGKPTHWADYAGKMYLWPTPDDAYTIKYRHTILAAALTNADSSTPVIPAEFHEVLVYGGWLRYAEQDQEQAALTVGIRAKYEGIIARMTIDNAKVWGGTPTQVSLGNFAKW